MVGHLGWVHPWGNNRIPVNGHGVWQWAKAQAVILTGSFYQPSFRCYKDAKCFSKVSSETYMSQALEISLLGELRVRAMGQEIVLPASKKARALLAFLVATGRPHRRERLCELFWDLPDDPKAALRWALSKLRRAVDTPDRLRIIADRERVQFDAEGIGIDILDIHARLRNQAGMLGVIELEDMATRLGNMLLDGLDGAGDGLSMHG